MVYKPRRQKKGMNSQRIKQYIYKPQHTSRFFSLQKNYFLADSPPVIKHYANLNKSYKLIKNTDNICGL